MFCLESKMLYLDWYPDLSKKEMKMCHALSAYHPERPISQATLTLLTPEAMSTRYSVATWLHTVKLSCTSYKMWACNNSDKSRNTTLLQVSEQQADEALRKQGHVLSCQLCHCRPRLVRQSGKLHHNFWGIQETSQRSERSSSLLHICEKGLFLDCILLHLMSVCIKHGDTGTAYLYLRLASAIGGFCKQCFATSVCWFPCWCVSLD